MNASTRILAAHANAAGQGRVPFLNACGDHVTLGPSRPGRGRKQMVKDRISIF